MITQAGEMGQFEPDEANPLETARHTQAHMLLFHGTADTKIPASHSKDILAAASGSRLILLDNEDHDSIMQDRSEVLTRETIGWFKQWLSPFDN